jgi:hypothetical protein
MWLLVLLIVLAVALFVWNRRQALRIRERWDDFGRRLGDD